MYVLTAAHCLYNDADEFLEPLKSIELHLYNPSKKVYQRLMKDVDFSLASPHRDKDFAILVLDRRQVEEITGSLPHLSIIRERHAATKFVIKGFPSATNGQEIVSISPVWAQDIPTSDIFQLQLNQDFSSRESAGYQISGFSGGGAFIVDDGQLYLLGLFTRFLDAGKMIYCQYLPELNSLLDISFLPAIHFSYFGNNGLNPAFFLRNAEQAKRNLGPRFQETLNLKLPIAFRFNVLTKDNIFKKQLAKVTDAYLHATNYNSGDQDGIKEIENSYRVIDQLVRDWYNSIDWSPANKIDGSAIITAISAFEDNCQQKLSELRQLSYEKIKADKGETKAYSYSPPYQGAINRLQQMQKNNRDFLYDIDDLYLDLSNEPTLLIKGEAGSGKSHLMGDIVLGRTTKGQPAILLLGQLFRREQTIWQNILNLLGLTCTSGQFLDSLDQIGRQTGTRVLLMLDALNEGAGKSLWFAGLAGFISEVKQYPHIALVISVRTSYWKAIVPSSVYEDKDISIITHEGFKGNEYKALQLFCEHFNIRQPNFPILAPEYTNPLLLQLICKGIKASGEQAFPQGFQGITKIFSYYIQAVQEKLTEKRSEYGTRPKLVRMAMEKLAAVSFKEKRSRYLSIEQAVELFDTEFARFPYLLDDLIEESVLIRSMVETYDESDKDVVYFAYERFGDFFLAEQLLNEFSSQAEMLTAFQNDGRLGKLINDFYWSNEGILEALAVLLPEKWNTEITQAFYWVFEERKEDDYDHTGDSINRWMVQSMKWRRIDSINIEKTAKWINESGHFRMDIGSWLYFIIEVTAVTGHPFNADRLFHYLKRNTMAQRDGFWQDHIAGYHGYDDSKMAFPITRLIDWAWQKNISRLTDTETARLVGQTLCWILSTTNRGLRDQVTKALTNLLQHQPKALTALLNKFDDVDDSYIKERLYAVAYGCALRSAIEDLRSIAHEVYSLIFKAGNPPLHILLRDYARNIIEYAVHRDNSLMFDLSLIRPPYRSKMPEKFPSGEEIKKLEEANQRKDSNKDHDRAVSQIAHSVIDWDFGRYVINNKLSSFSPISFRFKTEIDLFRANLPRGGKKYMDVFNKFYDLEHEPKGQRRLDPETRATINEFYEKLEADFRKFLTPEQMIFLDEKLLPYWAKELQLKTDKWSRMEEGPIKNWIVKRVFELGYNGELHGAYDNRYTDYDHRTGGRVERIGKKYQWIALHEILGILADNYKISDRWSTKRKEKFYNGPWELSVRDIDPSFTKKNRPDKYADEEEPAQYEGNGSWWSVEKYDYWYRLPADWADSTADLPAQLKCIEKKDSQGLNWLHLNFSYIWKEPKIVGNEKYGSSRKEIWYSFEAFLVPQNKAKAVLNWLKTKNFHGRWLPENYAVTDLLYREHYWSPISQEWQKENPKWKSIDQGIYKVQLATEEAVGEMGEDSSGARFPFDMPSKTLFEGMGLQYGEEDGEFVDFSGVLIATNVSPLGCMIRKDKLLSFLEEQKLDIIWALLGEKNAFNKGDYSEDHRKSLSGVYYFEGKTLTGEMTIANW